MTSPELMTRRLIVGIAAVALVAACAPTTATRHEEAPQAASPIPDSTAVAPSTAQASGVFPKMIAGARWPAYDSIAGLRQAADLIVRGQVVAVGPGRTIAGPASLPFTNASLLVGRVVKGESSPGETVTVEQTGGFYISPTVVDLQRLPQATPPPGAGPGVGPYPRPSPGSEYVFAEVEGDPLFFVREEVVLFLRWKPELGVYQILGPQGRFRVLGEHLQAMKPDDPIVGRFHGQTVDSLLGEVGNP